MNRPSKKPATSRACAETSRNNLMQQSISAFAPQGSGMTRIGAGSRRACAAAAGLAGQEKSMQAARPACFHFDSCQRLLDKRQMRI
ncbi:hypothetical protein [Paracidovorax sp. MALMAid1276]|uniref:hypothetical protein n=1 Tax=Paracidovorax sp. MALMAid1276 TaxID=3411631 RepID=UPI003B9A585E